MFACQHRKIPFSFVYTRNFDTLASKFSPNRNNINVDLMCLLNNIIKYYGDCKTDKTSPCTADQQAAVISFRPLGLAVLTHYNTKTVSLSSEAALLLTASQGSKPPHWAGDLSDWVTSDRRNVLSGL